MTKQRYHYQINIREREDARFLASLAVIKMNVELAFVDEVVYFESKLVDTRAQALYWADKIIIDYK